MILLLSTAVGRRRRQPPTASTRNSGIEFLLCELEMLDLL